MRMRKRPLQLLSNDDWQQAALGVMNSPLEMTASSFWTKELIEIEIRERGERRRGGEEVRKVGNVKDGVGLEMQANLSERRMQVKSRHSE